jgi:hypothetical protein
MDLLAFAWLCLVDPCTLYDAPASGPGVWKGASFLAVGAGSLPGSACSVRSSPALARLSERALVVPICAPMINCITSTSAWPAKSLSLRFPSSHFHADIAGHWTHPGRCSGSPFSAAKATTLAICTSILFAARYLPALAQSCPRVMWPSTTAGTCAQPAKNYAV